jgi:cell wall-associated NlpC family hydrolase
MSTRPSGSGSTASYIRADIVGHAKELMGLRYKYGGNNPRQGFDCSGFVLYLYQNAGIDINRISRDQAKQGRSIPTNRARPGDLVFFKRNGKAVHHVSVIVEVGVNKLIVVHATNSGVIRENILESRYWEPMIYQVRDILN